ncbi:GTP cyclohydrolase I FolE2 [Streptomyces griseomycini]|uniref:GTP cyclohydrolase I n=1 Tax=Streptomyces griseomycini TaxID=66895 RepID=A0A7W7PUU5_9ACTN|nr:GTP cyclohydrolase I FolE2 [Streptomyces griseomycini]MBB4901700.1 GTP cyclohydrolase I [Streptomyces griseomycini]GGR49972.1 GTP cyclohydrolase FolE2 [Streptomyces griseomycini]
MHDVQNEYDSRGIEIDEVGIAGLRFPVAFDDGVTKQSGIADAAVTVRLQADRRGTHMSRMVALAQDELATLDPRDMPHVLKEGAALLDTPTVKITVSMPFAQRVAAPATGKESWQVHNLTIEGLLEDGQARVTTTVMTEVTSLCPCSKAISDYGAHNQRSEISLSVTGYGDTPYPTPVDEAVAVLRASGSAPVVPLVKRPDERVLTMQAYDHPVFVEDMARTVSAECRGRGLRHSVKVRNLESIHSHDAIAFVAG